MAHANQLTEKTVYIEWNGEMPKFLKEHQHVEETMAANGSRYTFKVVDHFDGLICIVRVVSSGVSSGQTHGEVWVPLSKIAAIQILDQGAPKSSPI